MDSKTKLISLEGLFLALSDKTRLRLLGLMADGDVSVGYLADELGESQPKVSRHLAYLRGAGMVSTRRDGKWIYYGIAEQDEIVTGILQMVLNAVTGGTGEPPEPRSTRALTNIFAHAHVMEWKPNEIDVYLL